MKNMITNLRGRVNALLVAVSAMLVGAVAFAEPTVVESLDASAIATEGVSTLGSLAADAQPYIAAAIGLGILLAWLKRVFKF